MELPFKRLIDERFIRKDGNCIVFIQYKYSARKTTSLNTQIEVPPAYCDYNRGCIKEELPQQYGNVNELNTELRRMFRVAENIVLFIHQKKMPDPGAFAKKTFTPQLDSARLKDVAKDLDKVDVKTNLDFFFQIEDYILTKSKR